MWQTLKVSQPYTLVQAYFQSHYCISRVTLFGWAELKTLQNAFQKWCHGSKNEKLERWHVNMVIKESGLCSYSNWHCMNIILRYATVIRCTLTPNSLHCVWLLCTLICVYNTSSRFLNENKSGRSQFQSGKDGYFWIGRTAISDAHPTFYTT
jgi:hypothetical protein